MTAKQKFNSLTAYKAIQKMKKRNIAGCYCETKEEALQKALELIPENASVAFGGSETIKEIGLLDTLRNGSYRLIDRDAAKNAEEKHKAYHDSFSAKYYVMSANAITADGKLINLDGIGNRVSALIYGPENVIIIAGINKIVPDEESGIKRVRRIAAPMNAMRMGINTPCISSGTCHECTEDECICCQLVITRMSRIPNRIKVILVGEELGF